MALRARKFDNIAEKRDVHLAILDHFLFFPGAPPFHRVNPGAGFSVAERVFGELIEPQAMAELLMQYLVNVEREGDEMIHRRVTAQDFEIEAIPVVGDDSREISEFGDKFRYVGFKPTTESVVFLPCDGHGDAKVANARPSAFDFVRKPQSFNVEVNFASKKVH